MGKVKKIIPELRFPEFIIDGEWTIAPLSEVYSLKITNSFSRDKLNYKKGTVKNIHYGDIHTKFPTLFDITKETVPYINSDIPIDRIDQDNYCIEGDIVFADASEDLDDVGKSIEIVNLNNEQLLSGLHTFLARQIEPNLIVGFGGYLFKSKSIRTQIKRESQGSKVLGISKGRISDITIYYPENKEEQKKIASCLSSLDELIAAHNDKLDALKDHKKGLMQNLFPQEGKKVPNYRFPEFEDDGEWVIKNNSVKILSGNSYKRSLYSERGVRLVQGANIFNGHYSNKNTIYISSDNANGQRHIIVNKGDILLGLNRPITNNELKVCLFPFDQGYLYQRAGILEYKGDILGNFLYQFMCSPLFLERLKKELVGSDQPYIKSNLFTINILIAPSPPEQQKIASCLTAVDEVITEQVEKIEQLQLHKKGLMQGLFPKINN